MSAWPEALYVIKQLKTAIQDISYPIVNSASDLEAVTGTMRFSTAVLSDEDTEGESDGDTTQK